MDKKKIIFVEIGLVIGFIIVLFFAVFINSEGEKILTVSNIENESFNKVDTIYSTILKRNKIKVITHNSSTGYFLYRGRPMGFHYDLISTFADEIDVNLEIIVKDNLSDALDILNSGKGDIIAWDMTRTRDRENDMMFTNSIGYNRQVLVQRKKYGRKKDDKAEFIKKFIDLKSKKVYIEAGTVFKDHLEYLENVGSTDIQIIEDSSHTMEELILLVASGQIDYTVCDERIAKANSTYDSHIDYSLGLSIQQKLAWVVALGSDSLQYAVNSWLENFKTTKKFAVLTNKYFKTKKRNFYTNTEYSPLRGGQLSPYDAFIKKYAKQIGWDWRLLAAVIYQESRFNPNAGSWAGAKGLMQMMPAAAERFGLENPLDPEQSIRAGSKYLKYLSDKFSNPEIPKEEQIKFALASYNVGMGHVIDARKLAQKHNDDYNVWTNSVDTFIILKSNPKYYNDPVVKYGYCHGKETYAYVEKIFELYEHYKNLIK